MKYQLLSMTYKVLSDLVPAYCSRYLIPTSSSYQSYKHFHSESLIPCHSDAADSALNMYKCHLSLPVFHSEGRQFVFHKP